MVEIVDTNDGSCNARRHIRASFAKDQCRLGLASGIAPFRVGAKVPKVLL